MKKKTETPVEVVENPQRSISLTMQKVEGGWKLIYRELLGEEELKREETEAMDWGLTLEKARLWTTQKLLMSRW